jgi:alkanesulfonate monooxygenase SsuD/methylene tetrahydromethanopterin reductase-like flavin-dependent oxidoreductase (luciferase family)
MSAMLGPFVLRFDLRAPSFGAPVADLYAAALDMAAWSEDHGFTAIAVSEHHMSEDGYLPSPLIVASAMAARTKQIAISVAALLVPLYDPIKLAEDIAVLDHVSRGRVSYIAGIGYRPVEYESLGKTFSDRGRDIEAAITLMRKAWTGERFEHEGRTVMVRPKPYSDPYPMFCYGGGTPAAARRAARLDLPFFPQLQSDRLVDVYETERERLGLAPGFVISPGSGPLNVFVSEDPERTWAHIGANLLHDARQYAQWQIDAGLESVALDTATTVEQLRANDVYTVLTPDQCVELVRAQGALALHPLCGGIAPELAWECLELVADKVRPALTGP